MKAAIFDVMGVIFEVNDDINELLIPFVRERNPQITGDEVEEAFLQGSLGKLTSRGFWKKVGLGERADILDREYLQDRFTIDGEFLPLVSSLKKDYRIGLISNDIPQWNAFLLDSFGIGPWIDVAVVSGSLGIRKPDAGIFEAVLERLELPALECMYFDDRADNVDAARRLGFRAILFNRAGIGYDGERVASFHQIRDILDELRS